MKQNPQDDTKPQGILSKISKKYIMISRKDGVGKSTIAIGIAIGLVKKGYTVGLLDADFQNPSICRMLNMLFPRERETDNGAIKPCLIYNGRIKIMSFQFLLTDRNDGVLWRDLPSQSAINQFLDSIEWGVCDYLIIDSPPGTCEESISILNMIENPTGAIIVTTPREVSSVDAKKTIDLCKKINVPVFGVIENMAGFVCPKCNEMTHIFGKDGGRKMAHEIKAYFLGKIPIDADFIESGNSGRTFISSADASPAYSAIKRIVDFL